jgi:hypothetical protein
MKCFCASYNVGNIEVWQSKLYLNENSVFADIADSNELLDCFEKAGMELRPEIDRYFNKFNQ